MRKLLTVLILLSTLLLSGCGYNTIQANDEEVTAKWSDIGVNGPQKVRDVWRQKELGTFSDSFTGEVPRHGCLLLKISPAGARTQP